MVVESEQTDSWGKHDFQGGEGGLCSPGNTSSVLGKIRRIFKVIIQLPKLSQSCTGSICLTTILFPQARLIISMVKCLSSVPFSLLCTFAYRVLLPEIIQYCKGGGRAVGRCSDPLQCVRLQLPGEANKSILPSPLGSTMSDYLCSLSYNN